MFCPADTSSNPFVKQALGNILAKFSENVLLRDEFGAFVLYREVAQIARTKPFKLACRRLVMCRFENDIWGIAGYLALLAAGAVPMMVNSDLSPSSLDEIIEAYQPDYMWLPLQQASHWSTAELHGSLGGYALISLNKFSGTPDLHDDLTLLLSTSGSTGSGKYVRLSHQNVWSNASAISGYLKLTADERPITTLPPSYSFGLSVIHSHLWVGAGLAVTKKTFFERDFWNFFKEVKATSLAGVPYHFEILNKLRFTKMKLPHLHTLTQAGGRMSPELTKDFANFCSTNGMRFFTMYGQTEASPRISYVPAEVAFEKAGTIGIAIPGGKLELHSENGALISDPNIFGKLVYRGPNVCMGYAEKRSDLLLSDVNHGVLQTGDLALRDADGYYSIVGRQTRFIKLFGNRINLQDVEDQLNSIDLSAACTGRDDLLEIYLAKVSASKALQIKKTLISSLSVGAEGLAVYEIDELPRFESGKIRYVDLHPYKARLIA